MKTYYKPIVYHVCVGGRLPERSMRWFEEYIVTGLEDGHTRISGVMDQAALHGVLNRIRDLGVELISVECTLTLPSPFPPEPSDLEIVITLGLGLSVFSFYYNGYARSLSLKGDERVLDFGSGSGACSRHIARILQKGGGHLDCVDVSVRWQQALRRTLRRFDNVACRRGRLADLVLPASSYDAIVVHFVLHDVPVAERAGIFMASARLLRPGGRLLVREPSGRGLEPEELAALTSVAGLKGVRIETHRTLAGLVYDAEFTK